MKKILSYLSSLSLGFASVLPFTYDTNTVINNSINENNLNLLSNNVYEKDLNNVWGSIGIDHSVSVGPTGSHSKEDTKTVDYETSDISWENVFLKSNTVKVHGQFELSPYKDSRTFELINLYKIDNESTNQKIVWKSDDSENTQSSTTGWAHQTTSISITVTANYNSEDEITYLELSSKIYVKTSGAVHKCHTRSIINEVSFDLV